MSQELAFGAGTSAQSAGILLSLLGELGASNQLRFGAEQQELAAVAEKVQAQEQANIIRQQLVEDLSSQNALFASRGVGFNSGTALAAQSEASLRAGRAIRGIQNVGTLRAGARLTEASSLRQQAKQRVRFGIAKSIISLADLASSTVPGGSAQL